MREEEFFLLSDTEQEFRLEKLQLGSSARICVSVYGRTFADLRAGVDSARGFNPAFVELRLDYLEKVDPVTIVKLLMGQRRNEILTFRSRIEGGVSKFSEKQRIKLLREILSASKAPYVDIELATLNSFPDLLGEASAAGTRVIGSSHNFESIENSGELKSFITQTRYADRLFAIKIVRKARNFSDNAVILSAYQIAKLVSPTKLIAFCVGPFGILSRVACVPLGSPFTYVSLPKQKTAPGQLDAYVMQNLLRNW